MIDWGLFRWGPELRMLRLATFRLLFVKVPVYLTVLTESGGCLSCLVVRSVWCRHIYFTVFVLLIVLVTVFALLATLFTILHQYIIVFKKIIPVPGRQFWDFRFIELVEFHIQGEHTSEQLNSGWR